MEITCPKCSECFPIEAKSVIPKTQTLFLEMECKSEIICAKTIGKSILSMEALQREVAKEIGVNVCVFIKSIELLPNKIKIGFIIARV